MTSPKEIHIGVTKRPLVKFSIVDEDLTPSIQHYLLHDATTANSNLRKRPSLEQLHSLDQTQSEPRIVKTLDVEALAAEDETADENLDERKRSRGLRLEGEAKDKHEHVKFGWIRGVMIRSILCILGTLLYLRLSFLAGQAGLILGTVIILLSALITSLTALSMCALCTNGMIDAGGAYYMLSRSLGPKFGGSMGVIFALADGIASAMNVVGFGECVRDLLRKYNIVIVDDINDVRIIGVITMTILFSVVMISVSWESQIELVCLFFIVVSYANYIVGTFLRPSTLQMANGVTGYWSQTLRQNLYSHFEGESFLTVFGIFFPSTTGIMAGAGISGELREPAKALPKGTLLGILITTLMYLSGVWMTGTTCVRYASGNPNDVINGTDGYFPCQLNNTCRHGLMYDNNVMELESAFWPLLTAGVFATSISSALTLLVTSPRTIQAVANDKIFPKTEFLAVLSGKDQQPRRAYCVVFIICIGIICIGDLNAVAPLISNFYLASFALINLACFVGSISNAPNWRPAFTYYNQWVALFGALLCIAAMFMVNWYMALVTLLVMGFLYFFVHRNKPNVNWGASSNAQAYNVTLQNLNHMAFMEGHVKNYRPQVLVLSGNPLLRPSLVNFMSNITKDQSLLICGDVILHAEYDAYEMSLNEWRRQIQLWYKKRKIHAFYNPTTAPTLVDGYRALSQLAGLGHFKPDILCVGYKANWKDSTIESVQRYFQIIHEAFSEHMALVIVFDRGFDLTDKVQNCTLSKICHYLNLRSPYDRESPAAMPTVSSLGKTLVAESQTDLGYGSTQTTLGNSIVHNSVSTPNFVIGDRSDLETEASSRSRSSSVQSEDISINSLYLEEMTSKVDANVDSTAYFSQKIDFAINKFRLRVKKAVVDVWWLFDDGGLTLLLSYLLTTKRSYLKRADTRLFVYAKNIENTEKEKKDMYELLEKFRIKVIDIIMITDYDQPPDIATIDHFRRIVERFKAPTDVALLKQHPNFYITDFELKLLQHKTHRQLRTRELIMQHSKNSQLIIITMPVPKIGRESACMYMAWLETLTKNLTVFHTPVMLIRGNQQNVLTFYS